MKMLFEGTKISMLVLELIKFFLLNLSFWRAASGLSRRRHGARNASPHNGSPWSRTAHNPTMSGRRRRRLSREGPTYPGGAEGGGAGGGASALSSGEITAEGATFEDIVAQVESDAAVAAEVAAAGDVDTIGEDNYPEVVASSRAVWSDEELLTLMQLRASRRLRRRAAAPLSPHAPSRLLGAQSCKLSLGMSARGQSTRRGARSLTRAPRWTSFVRKAAVS